jgi:cytochrome c556
MAMKTKALIAIAAVFGVASATIAYAAAADVIKERQQGLKSLGEAFKTVRDELAGGKDMAKIKTASATISKVANSMEHWFPAGSGGEAGVKTAAKPEIWQDSATFNSARQRLVSEAAKFSQAANSGDLAAVRGGVPGLGGACKNCHDNFRVKED